jgi:hypothetical protein
MKHATCTCNNKLRKARDMQRATFTVTDATTCNDNMQPAQASNLPHAPFDMQRATCASDGEGRKGHEHTRSLAATDQTHGETQAAIPTVWVNFFAWVRSGAMGGADAAVKQTNKQQSQSVRRGGWAAAMARRCPAATP